MTKPEIHERVAEQELMIGAFEPLLDTEEVHESPSGRWRLSVIERKPTHSGWNCTMGTVTDVNGTIISVVYRNYNVFPFAWVEGHPDGHDYLVCGWHYQGHTVIRLGTGERSDAIDQFCRVEFHPSPNLDMLAVEGCIWAAPYEVRIYDFSDPMCRKWTSLDGSAPSRRAGTFIRWIDADSCELGDYLMDVRRSDGMPIDKLPQDEWPEDDDDWDESPHERFRWTRDQ